MLVILPTEGLMLLPEKMIGFGRLKFARFVMLKNSARNSTFIRSVIGVVLKTERVWQPRRLLADAGVLDHHKVRAVLAVNG